MSVKTVVLAFLLASAAATGAYAQANCETIRSDLTGQNVYGSHKMDALSTATQAGDCTAAAAMVRRAKDARGVLETTCPADTDLKRLAVDMMTKGQDLLDSQHCRD